MKTTLKLLRAITLIAAATFFFTAYIRAQDNVDQYHLDIRFPDGLLGRAKHIQDFTLSTPKNEQLGMSLVSHQMDDDGQPLSFIVLNAFEIFNSVDDQPLHYDINDEDLQSLGLNNASEGYFLVVVNHNPLNSIVDLRYPIMININSGLAKLVIPNNSQDWPSKHPVRENTWSP